MLADVPKMLATGTSIGVRVSLASLLLPLVLSFGCAEVRCPSGQTLEGGFCVGEHEDRFAVLETAPADGAANVASSASVTARFTSDVEAGTLDATTFSVATAHGLLSGQVGLGETSATAAFTPDLGLALLCEHTATLTTDVRSVDGSPLASDTIWTFRTRDGTWTEIDSIKPASASMLVDRMDVAFDDAGNALAVWEQRRVGPAGTIWASRFTPSEDWATPEQVSDGAFDATMPDLAVDGAGNALVVWQQDGSIWANRFAPSVGWFDAEAIETFGGSEASQPRVAMGPNGAGIAVWRQDSGGEGSIWSNSFTQARGWATQDAVEDVVGEARLPDVGMDGDGTATAVWEQMGGNHFDIWSSQSVLGCAEWSAPVLLENDDVDDAQAPRIAVSPTGIALVVWQQSIGVRSGVWSNVLEPGTSWGDPEAIQVDDLGDPANAHVAINADGNGVAVWTYDNATHASRYGGSTGWGDVALIEADVTGTSVSPQVAIDPNGNAVAVGSRVDGADSQVWRNRLPANGTWGSAERVEGLHTLGPGVAVDRLGYALFLWSTGEEVQWARLQ